ncbi:MAG: hypothetical protein HY847_19680 [Betaproteobacteria bacterium]|nr:hypothetical protein [Betaproteobacteria bacterium]
MTTQTTKYHELADELFDIQQELLELLDRARRLIRQAPVITYQRADAYWLAHAVMAITRDHQLLGGSMMTMDETVAEIVEAAKAEADEVGAI